MRLFPLPRSGRLSVALVVALLIAGCKETTPPVQNVVREIRIFAPSTTLRPGRAMTVVARPLDAAGELVELPVAWRSVTPELLTVTGAGELAALAPGLAVLEATAAGVTGRLELTLVNPPAVVLRFPSDIIRLTLPGTAATLQGNAFDADGELIIAARFQFSTETPRIATISAAGAITPVAVGLATIAVTLDGIRSARTVQVTPAVTAISPIVTSVSAATITAGVPFTITGQRFGATIAANTVHVDGLIATVTAATQTQLTAVLASAGLPCIPTLTAAVQVTTVGGVGAGSARVQLAPQRSLGIGESLVLTNASSSACNELSAGTGRYLVTVQHAGRALGAGSIALALDGRAGVGDAVVIYEAHNNSDPARVNGVATAPARAHARAHGSVLDASGAAVRIMRAAQLSPATSAPRRTAALEIPPVNGIVPVRVPDLESASICSNFTTIGARTVFQGTNVVILEDTLSKKGGVPTLAGAMDELYAEVGREFDAVLWPLAQRFGDPLVMDSRLDDNGKVVLVATPRMNDFYEGELLGAVVTCDLFSRAQFAASNVGEMMYLQVPTSLDIGLGHGTRARWSYEIRGTIAHELKHIVSFAGRVVRMQPLEESWLEEATARHAEELFARARLGFSPTGNTGYAALQCESRVLLGDPTCAGTPRAMLPHFEGLWDFLSAPATHSPLGATTAGDVSFYGSAWSLTRWSIDHGTSSEESFLQQLTSSGQSGVTNLEARSGRTWDDILGRWSLALFAETRGANVLDATLRLPSWDLANLFAGLCTDVGACGSAFGAARFTRAQPLRPVVMFAPNFSVQTGDLVPGGFAAIEVAPGAAGSRRLLNLRNANGGALPPTARLAIVRIE